MMKTTAHLIITMALLLAAMVARPQGVSVADTIRIPGNYKPAQNRELRHDNIDNEQKSILASDGQADRFFKPSDNEEINFLLSQSLVKKVDALQYLIETDSLLDHRLKVTYLSGLEFVLRYFRQNWKLKSDKRVNPYNLAAIINGYETAMMKDRKGESIEPLINSLSYDAGMNVLVSIFEKNTGYIPAKNNLVLKYCSLHPEKTLATLRDNPNMPFADSLVRALDKRTYARQLYDFAQANNQIGSVIRNITDDIFIRTIVKMARSRSGQQYFPFLDNIVKGKMTIEEIDSVKEDSLQYYKLLVRTQMDYVARAIEKDTAFEFKALTERLEKKAREDFVNVINGLHNETPEVRFRSIQPLSAEELYYLAVSSDGTIYTSSFVKGVYPLMMKKINNKGDSLLMSLKFDKYRKFIKMAAGYNTLSNFLSSFPPKKSPDEESDAEILMKAFVGRLEQGNGLEDGVDVADSYASIAETIQPLATEMLRNIGLNYQRNEKSGNKRGMAIYNILTKLFLSADTTTKTDLTKELGIPPVYEVPYQSLVNDSGRVIMQVFFYGDKDGQGIFRGFVGMFSNANWKITGTDKWIQITSVKGKPVSIFANRALPEEGGEDEKAQKELCDYLAKNKLLPTITIHRGHSYYANSTIEQMFSSSKIVFLGSCGGYHLVHDVLSKASDAHIIASKQIGATEVNRPFFQLLTEKVRNGNNIDWIPFWKELDKMVTAKEFEDYIPPYKNLGALFIKAYKIAMGEED
ncbi:MAG TPA: hypothetical protein VFV31_10740 [Chitinophagaceae bacterium]|nr:hypothetical protein [Chitinophagaceae bacterium]